MNEQVIYLYGEFGYEITAKEISEQIKKFDKSQHVTIRINSCGGDVFEAIAIKNLLNGFVVNVINDGLCASSATFLISISEKVSAAIGSMFMFHKPTTGGYNFNANDLRNKAEVLDKIENENITAYLSDNYKGAEFDLNSSELWVSSEELATCFPKFLLLKHEAKPIAISNNNKNFHEKYKNICKNLFYSDFRCKFDKIKNQLNNN